MRLAYALEAETVVVTPTVANTENINFPISLRAFANQIQDHMQDHIQDKSADQNLIKTIIINQIFSKKNSETILNNLQKIHGIKTNIINKYLEITQPIFAKNINGVIDIIADKIPDPNQSTALAHLPDVLKNIAQTPPMWVWEDPNTHSHFQYWQGTVPNQPYAQAQLSLMRLLWDFPETDTPRVSVQISHAALHSRVPFGAAKS